MEFVKWCACVCARYGRVCVCVHNFIAKCYGSNMPIGSDCHIAVVKVSGYGLHMPIPMVLAHANIYRLHILHIFKVDVCPPTMATIGSTSVIVVGLVEATLCMCQRCLPWLAHCCTHATIVPAYVVRTTLRQHAITCHSTCDSARHSTCHKDMHNSKHNQPSQKCMAPSDLAHALQDNIYNIIKVRKLPEHSIATGLRSCF